MTKLIPILNGRQRDRFERTKNLKHAGGARPPSAIADIEEREAMRQEASIPNPEARALVELLLRGVRQRLSAYLSELMLGNDPAFRGFTLELYPTRRSKRLIAGFEVRVLVPTTLSMRSSAPEVAVRHRFQCQLSEQRLRRVGPHGGRKIVSVLAEAGYASSWPWWDVRTFYTLARPPDADRWAWDWEDFVVPEGSR